MSEVPAAESTLYLLMVKDQLRRTIQPLGRGIAQRPPFQKIK